jgi:hypothetical protein
LGTATTFPFTPPADSAVLYTGLISTKQSGSNLSICGELCPQSRERSKRRETYAPSLYASLKRASSHPRSAGLQRGVIGTTNPTIRKPTNATDKNISRLPIRPTITPPIAKRYEGRIKKGGILVSVHCDNSEWVGRAKDLLKQTGAEDISSAGEASADYAESDKPLPRRTSSGDYGSTKEDVALYLNRVLRNFGASSTGRWFPRQNPCFQQIETSPAVHLSFDHLQSIDLSFHRPVVPAQRNRWSDLGLITLERFGELSSERKARRNCFLHPLPKPFDLAQSQYRSKT